MPHLPGAENLFNQNPFGSLGMGYPQMGAYGQYGYPNSAAMMNSFLSSMGQYGSTSAMEKEIMMLSQMYNSPYAGLLASTARGGPSSNPYPYGSPYNSSLMPPMQSSSGGPMPYTPTTSGSAGGSLFGPSAFNSSNNLMSNINNYLPPFNKSPNSMPPIAAHMSGPSSSAAGMPASASRPLHQTSALRDIDKDVWSYLTSASNMYAKDDLMGANAMGAINYSGSPHVPPGPNAMKNPLLFKELSIPCAEPVPSGSAAHNIPSIPTSVITSVGFSKESPKLPSVSQSAPKTPAAPTNATATNLATMSTSTVTTAATPTTGMASVNKDLLRTMTAANPIRRSPLTTKATAALLSPTPSSSSPRSTFIPANANNAATRNSPESHLIVKNVNAINQSIKPTATSAAQKQPAVTTQTSPKPTNQPIKTTNMGIVYPTNKNATELNPKNTILKAAQAQLNALTTTKSFNISATNTNQNMTTTPKANVTLTSAASPAGQKNTRITATRSVPLSSSSPTVGGSTKAAIRRPPDATVPKANDTKSQSDPKRWTNQSGLTISPVPNTTALTYKAPPVKSTTLAGGSAPTAKANVYAAAAQNLLKNKTKPTPGVVTTIRQPNTGGPTPTTTLIRQNTAPNFASTQQTQRINNVIQSTNNGTTIIRQTPLSKPRPVPPLVRQNTSPAVTTSTLSHPGSSATIKTLTTSPGGTPRATIMNRNVTVRRVNASPTTTTTAPAKTIVMRPLYSSPTGTSSGSSPTITKRIVPATGMAVQRSTTASQPSAKVMTTNTVRTTTANRAVTGAPLPMRPLATAMRTTTTTSANGSADGGVVRRIVVGTGGATTAAAAVGRPAGATSAVQRSGGVVRTMPGGGQIISTSAGATGTASAHKV